MEKIIEENLEKLRQAGKLDRDLVLWGAGGITEELIKWLRAHHLGSNLKMIADNFKAGMYAEYEGIPVEKPGKLLKLKQGSFNVLFVLGEEQSESVRRQLFAYGISEAYNLRNLSAGPDTARPYRYDLPYGFTNRSRNKRYLCYILAGYEAALWNSTLARIEAFQKEDVDYCLVSSGTYNAVLETIAERNNWSYLYTFQNQVCYIQNLAIELHPKAEYILKMDEDMLVGKEFFPQMIREFHQIEKEGEYRVGFAAPVIHLNCGGCMSYLKVIGKKEEYEKRFGRLYRSRYCGIYGEEQAEFLWDTMENFDSMAERFLQNRENRILNVYYNIGCIMFTRERWYMMGKWPERPGESGMGTDERFICEDNQKKDLAVYEIGSVLAGHLAFGPQKRRMLRYYEEHFEKFWIANPQIL